MSNPTTPAPGANAPDPRPSTPAGDDLVRLAALVAELLGVNVAAIAVKPIPFAAFQAELLDLYRPPLRSKGAFGKLRQVLEILSDLIGPGTTAELTPALIGRFVASRPPGQSGATLKSLLGVVRAACRYAIERRYLAASPFAARAQWVRPTAPKAKRHHSAEDIARVLELARATVERKTPGSRAQWRAWRTYAAVSIVAYTGVRKGECLRLWVEDVDFRDRTIRIVERNGTTYKTVGSAAPVAMPDALASILAGWIDFLGRFRRVPDDGAPRPSANPDGRVEPQWLIPNQYRTGAWLGGSPGWRPLDALRRLGERAGVEGLTFLSLRHSWATHAESLWGFSEALIQRQLRHTNTRTQHYYRHADTANMAAAMRGIDFGTTPPCPDAGAVLTVTEPPAMARPSKPGTYRGQRKLDDEDVVEARELRDRGWSYAQLCRRYSVSKGTMSMMINGLTHRHVPMPPGSEGP
jgi:integrase